MSGFDPSLPSFCAFFLRCFSFCFLGGWGGLTIAAAPILLFFTPYPKYTCFWLSKIPNKRVAYLFLFWRVCLSRIFSTDVRPCSGYLCNNCMRPSRKLWGSTYCSPCSPYSPYSPYNTYSTYSTYSIHSTYYIICTTYSTYSIYSCLLYTSPSPRD